MQVILNKIFPELNQKDYQLLVKSSVLSTKFSPTINLNRLFSLIPGNINLMKSLQSMLLDLMNELLITAKREGLEESFYLHIAPNLGTANNVELIK